MCAYVVPPLWRQTKQKATLETASNTKCERRDTEIFREDDAMKIKNVFDLIFSMENLHAALEDASRGRRYQKDVLAYNLDAWEKAHFVERGNPKWRLLYRTVLHFLYP